jgi:hypothetical protein
VAAMMNIKFQNIVVEILIEHYEKVGWIFMCKCQTLRLTFKVEFCICMVCELYIVISHYYKMSILSILWKLTSSWRFHLFLIVHFLSAS